MFRQNCQPQLVSSESMLSSMSTLLSGTLTSSNLCAITFCCSALNCRRWRPCHILKLPSPLPLRTFLFSPLILVSSLLWDCMALCTLSLWQAARACKTSQVPVTIGFHPHHYHIRPLPPHRPLLRLPLLYSSLCQHIHCLHHIRTIVGNYL